MWLSVALYPEVYKGSLKAISRNQFLLCTSPPLTANAHRAILAKAVHVHLDPPASIFLYLLCSATISEPTTVRRCIDPLPRGTNRCPVITTAFEAEDKSPTSSTPALPTFQLAFAFRLRYTSPPTHLYLLTSKRCRETQTCKQKSSSTQLKLSGETILRRSSSCTR